jgi:hypothetical protein
MAAAAPFRNSNIDDRDRKVSLTIFGDKGCEGGGNV